MTKISSWSDPHRLISGVIPRHQDLRTGVYRILKRYGLKRLPNSTCKRKLYNNQVPGHYIQVNVKLLTLAGENSETVRRFQYIATNDVTWVRALKIYVRHTQAAAIDFVGFAIERFPFRINKISTDNGHEFQASFH